jgi:hypothetical protein
MFEWRWSEASQIASGIIWVRNDGNGRRGRERRATPPTFWIPFFNGMENKQEVLINWIPGQARNGEERERQVWGFAPAPNSIR